MPESHDVVYSKKAGDGVEVVYLSQPKKKNAISARMMVLLRDLLIEADADDDVRVVVLRGEGDVFSSGGDLSQSTSGVLSPETSRKTYRHYVDAQLAVRHIAKPVIAMVDGYAVGGAFALVLASDLVCVAKDAKLIPAFCQIGIAPEMGMAKLLPSLVGAQRAKEILFLGDALSGEDLYRLGIANRVCEGDELEEVAMGLAKRVAAMPDASIQVTKGMVNSLADSGFDVSLTMEQTASPFCTTTEAFANVQAKFSHERS